MLCFKPVWGALRHPVMEMDTVMVTGLVEAMESAAVTPVMKEISA